MDEARTKHLEFIQAVITRMAQNSFMLKGWALTLVAAILALALIKDARLMLVALLPLLAFWGLDGFYLRQERLFRRLYDAVRSAAEDSPNAFSMDTSSYRSSVASWWRTCWSGTIAWFYGSMAAATVAIAAVVHL